MAKSRRNRTSRPAQTEKPMDKARPYETKTAEEIMTPDPTPKLEHEEGSLYTWGDDFFASYLPTGDGRITVFGQDEYLSRDYEQMLARDGRARAVEQVITLPIRAAKWSIEPGDGDTGEADFIKKALTTPPSQGGMQTPMSMVIAQALSARTYRHACFEKVFTEKDGKIVYKKLAFRPASTTGILRNSITGEILGFQQRPVPVAGQTLNQAVWVEIPLQYAWVHLNNQHIGGTFGHSDMELIFWLHNQKNKIWYLWASFLEVQAAGRYVVTALDETVAQKYARAVRQMKNGGVVGVSGEQAPKIDHLEGGTGAAALFKAFLDYCDQQMSDSVLAGFMNLTGGAHHGGSYALSKDQSDFFLKSLTATANELAESITTNVIADLVKYNFGDKGVCPQFKFAPLTEHDLDTIKDILVAFATAQVDPRVPQAFISELCLMLAGYLNMPVDDIKAQFDEVEKRLEEKAQLDLEGKKVGLETQKNLANQANNPVAGMAARKNAGEIMGTNVRKNGAKVNAATQMVKQKKAADVAKASSTPKPTQADQPKKA